MNRTTSAIVRLKLDRYVLPSQTVYDFDLKPIIHVFESSCMIRWPRTPTNLTDITQCFHPSPLSLISWRLGLITSVVMVALHRLVLADVTPRTDRDTCAFLQGFRSRSKTCLAWTGPTTACYQSQPEAKSVWPVYWHIDLTCKFQLSTFSFSIIIAHRVISFRKLAAKKSQDSLKSLRFH